jgi:hypothetical protein
MTDQQPQQRQMGSGCGAWLAWFLAAGLVRYLARDWLGWGPGGQLAAVLALLLVWALVIAARNQADK